MCLTKNFSDYETVLLPFKSVCYYPEICVNVSKQYVFVGVIGNGVVA